MSDTYFDLTPEGKDYFNDYETSGKSNSYSDFLGAVLEKEYDLEQEYPKEVKRALRLNHIVLDKRSIEEVIADITRIDRELGKSLGTFTRLAKQKQVRDSEIDEALMILAEKYAGEEIWDMESDITSSKDRKFEDIKTQVTKGIKGSRGQKIASLNNIVMSLHRDGFMGEGSFNQMDEASYYHKEGSVARVLDMLSR